MANEITRQIMANLTGLSAGARDSAGTAAVSSEAGRSEQYDLTPEEEDKLLSLIGADPDRRSGSAAAPQKPWLKEEPRQETASPHRAGSRPAGAARGGFLTLDELADQV